MNHNKQYRAILFFATLLFTIQLSAQPWIIKRGETLRYKVAFNSGLTGNIQGGEASLSVKNSMVEINKTPTFHTEMKIATSGIVDLFYQVSNVYESFIAPDLNAPLLFRQNIHEKKYLKTDTVQFFPAKKIAIYRGKSIPIVPSTQDFVSMIYYVRTFDYSKMSKSDSFDLPFFTSEKVQSLKVIYGGLEEIKVNGKMVKCHAFRPQIMKNKVFNQDFPATIWISNDTNRTPMMIEAKMKVGKVKMELIK